MQRIIRIILLMSSLLSGNLVSAQDWDDFEPPPPADFGNIPPPPPPPPMAENPIDDRPASPSPYSNPTFSSGPSGGGQASGTSGPIHFKKTGKQKDLTKVNSRIQELIKLEKGL